MQINGLCSFLLTVPSLAVVFLDLAQQIVADVARGQHVFSLCEIAAAGCVPEGPSSCLAY